MEKTSAQGPKPSSPKQKPSQENPPAENSGVQPGDLIPGDETETKTHPPVTPDEEGADLGNPPEGIASEEGTFDAPVKEEKAKSKLGEVSGHALGKTPLPPVHTAETATPGPGKGGPNEDGSFSAYTYPGYTPGEKEAGHFHVELESPKFSPTTGARLSKPFVQKYNPQAFAKFFKTHRALGYVINRWLHQPEVDAPRKKRAKR